MPVKIPEKCGPLTRDTYAMLQYFLKYKDPSGDFLLGAAAMKRCIVYLKALKAPKSLEPDVYRPLELFPWVIASEDQAWAKAFLQNIQKGKNADVKAASKAKEKADASASSSGAASSGGADVNMSAAMRMFGLST